ncbi:MAG: PqqD family protein [bacterium]
MKDPLSLSCRLRIPGEILFHDLQGEAVILNLETGVYFTLDAVGSRVWQLIQEHAVPHRIVACLVDEYDVSEAACAKDVLGLVARMRENGLVEVVD